MARVKNGSIIGLLGNLVFYKRGEQLLVRTNTSSKGDKRGKVRDPNNTAFTIISASVSPMVTRLKECLLLPVKLQTYNNTRGWVRELYDIYAAQASWPLAERNLCQLNPSLDLRDYLQVKISISDIGNGQVGVSIPALNPVQNIKAPLHTQQVRIKVIAVTAPFTANRSWPTLTTDQYSFPYTNTLQPGQDFVLNTGARKGDMAMVAIAMEYASYKEVYSTAPDHLPAVVMAIGKLE